MFDDLIAAMHAAVNAAVREFRRRRVMRQRVRQANLPF
jgi:hypothetical protein